MRRLQVNNQQPLREIAEAVHLSAASVQRRIRRLEAGGVIAAHEARIAPEAVGLSLTIIVTVELERETPADIDAAKRLFLAAPEVQQCHYVTGESDFVLVVVVAQMSDYEALHAPRALRLGQPAEIPHHGLDGPGEDRAKALVLSGAPQAASLWSLGQLQSPSG